jgi:hypothetical protein
MLYISHRINYLDSATAATIFSASDGIEFDIRDSNGQLIVQHDACKEGQLFSAFLEFCPPNKLYIVNIKAEGIEESAIKLLTERGIQNFFLLDCGMPSLVRLGRTGEKRLAVRFSEYESFETVAAIAPFVSWIWVDVFTRFPLTKQISEQAKKLGLRLCLVSPELQGQPEKRETYLTYCRENEIELDAICTKQPYIPFRAFSLSQ